MSSDWRLLPLGDLTINHDGKRKPVKEADRKSGAYPYYGASGIVDYVDGYLFDGEYLLIGEDGENLRSRQTPIAFLARNKFWVNNHAHIVTGNNLADTRFLLYALLNADLGPFLTGAVMPKLTQGNLNRIPILCPPLSTQRAIVDVLGGLDDRISLLRETNATLEAIVQALFKSWFVDFDPVRAKLEGREPESMDAETAALFPNRFEEASCGLIPQGWKLGTVGDIASVRAGFAYKSQSFGDVGAPVVKIKNIVGDGTVDLSDVQRIDADLADKTKKFALQDGDVLIAMTGATIGKTGIVVTDGHEVPYLNQRVGKFESDRSGRDNTWFVFTALQQEFAFRQVLDAASGSAQPNVSANGIESIRLVLPTNNILLSAFKTIVTPIFSKWIANQGQSLVLAELRDTLLPRLISGQLRLSEAKEQFNEALTGT